jgi:hypothetical protein
MALPKLQARHVIFFLSLRARGSRATSVERRETKQGHSRSEWSDSETGASASSLARESGSEAPLGLPKQRPACFLFDSLVPTLLTLRANLRLLFLTPALALDCG